jgi:hypothetical protein
VPERRYESLHVGHPLSRRSLLRAAGAVAAGGVVLGTPGAGWAGAKTAPEVRTNLDEFVAVPRGPHAIPGPHPGRVVRVHDPACLTGETIDAAVVRGMVERGIPALTGQDLAASFAALFTPQDVVGIKVNPVGPPLIAVKHEVVQALIGWLEAGGLTRDRIVIWDRFEDMLTEAGFTAKRYPGVQIVGLQAAIEEEAPFKDEQDRHLSDENFDQDASYLAEGVEGGAGGYHETADSYLRQHVVAGERSYFGTLVTSRLTKIINVASFKNTGNGVSMATKNLGYGAINNTGRLHSPLFFRVCTEVCAAPWIRDKLVLNVLDGIRGQYDGGPMMNEQFVYPLRTLYLATDPFALDRVGHDALVAKRKAEGVTVNEHPRFTDYLRQGEELGLGVADPEKIALVDA